MNLTTLPNKDSFNWQNNLFSFRRKTISTLQGVDFVFVTLRFYLEDTFILE